MSKPFIYTEGKKRLSRLQMKEGVCCRGAASSLEIKLFFVDKRESSKDRVKIHRMTAS